MKNRILSLLFVFLSSSVIIFAENSKINLNFKDADIRVVLESLAEKSGVNIVAAPEVTGLVSVKLNDVDWETALDVITQTYGYGYEWINKEIVMVTTLENLAEKRKKEAEVALQEPLEIATYSLQYLDANDVKKAVAKQLTERGRITVLEIAPQKGWKSRGGMSGDFTKAERQSGARTRSKVLIITDTKSNIRNVLAAIKSIDVRPKQVLIEARLMEVNEDTLKDLGVDWGTGNTVGAGTMGYKTGTNNKFGILGTTSQNKPSIFGAKAAGLSGVWPFNSGLSLLYEKLTGTQFQILLHALEEDVHTNTLSSPRILTLDGQEAYIMVGERRPIIKSSMQSSQDATGINQELDYYQNLGIELNVVPQVCSNDSINLTIYPSVTSSSSSVTATSTITGQDPIENSYPIIDVRETQTQVVMKDGETIVIGGLLKDVKSEGVYKTPILGDIPLLGLLFRRKTHDIQKIDLIIFITAHIVKDGEFTPEQISQLQQNYR